MNSNIEYEKFTQEVYQELVNAEGVKTIEVKHNIKLEGRSGQKHQIDVYWEYEIAGVKQKVAIECKNYNKEVPIGKVRDFYGVLSDLNNVAGIMVTKVGYQEGTKKYATYYGISLKELRIPNIGEGIIGEIKISTNMEIRHCLFLVDEEWAKDKNIDFKSYRKCLDLISVGYSPREGSINRTNSTHIPLETKDRKIRNRKGRVITTLDKLENKLPENFETNLDYIFEFQDAYIDTRYWGPIKIKEVKYVYEKENQTTNISIDAHEFIKAILKDAINGEIRLIIKNA